MLVEFAKAFLAMFVIIDPLTSVPIFLALTKKATAKQRARAARDAAIVAGVTIVLFTLVGVAFLNLIGVQMQSFKIAGGIVLLVVGVYSVLGMSFTEKKKELEVAVVLIAVPMITGPGAMSMAIILSETYGKEVVIAASVCAVFLTWVFLRFANSVRRLLGDHGLEIYSRIFGLFVAALAIQFISEGIRSMVVG
jgi:multiple antibiotic resistance protein